MRKNFYIISFITLSAQLLLTFYFDDFYYSFILTLPVFFLGIYEILQTKRTLMRNYPIVGRARYWMEILRPKIYQYFIESDTDGTPINRINRSIVYQRAKEQLSTTPFGTQLDVYKPGYEWVNHSMFPLALNSINEDNLRVKVGSDKCTQPYSLSLFNISAMSYGALSYTAISSLNKGAKLGGFAHNTGEGGVSEYHLEHGGDLIWQIGTGLFGCRNSEGKFDDQKFIETAKIESVKMIEIKLSQGAKPGHGGILPAVKNTPKIAKARGVEPYTTIESPSSHNSFGNYQELLGFISKLRELSDGKPIGVKLCVGRPSEFKEFCEAMKEASVYPDFISIDGGEGGTGAAPLEFTNSIGMSLMDGLLCVSNILKEFGIKDQIKIIVSGKMFTGFDIIKALCVGADACYSARGMMLALGCIQALTCNSNHCPTGIATQDPFLARGIDIADKANRVHHFHKHTLAAVAEMLCSMGISDTSNLSRKNLWRRIDHTTIKNYDEIFPINQ